MTLMTMVMVTGLEMRVGGNDDHGVEVTLMTMAMVTSLEMRVGGIPNSLVYVYLLGLG